MEIRKLFEELSSPYLESTERLKKSFRETEMKVRMLSLEELLEIVSHKYDTTIAFSVLNGISIFSDSVANESVKNIICDIAINELIRRVCFVQMKYKKGEPITRYKLLQEICKTNGWHYEYLNNPRCIADDDNILNFLLRYINCFLISEEGGTTYYLHNTAHKYIDCLPQYQKEIMIFSGKTKYVPYKPERAELNLEKRCYQDILKAAIAISEAGEFSRNNNFLAKYTVFASEKVISLPYSENEIETFDITQLKKMAQCILNTYCEDALREQFYQRFHNFDFYDSLYRKGQNRFNDIFHDRYIHAICPVCGNLMHPAFYRYNWVWWHDNREDFFNGSHNTFVLNELTEDEIRKYHLDFLRPAEYLSESAILSDEDYDENNCHLDANEISDTSQKKLFSDADKKKFFEAIKSLSDTEEQDFFIESFSDLIEKEKS